MKRTKDWYVRDVSGSPMGIYTDHTGPTTDTNIELKEHAVYGASRVGIFYRDASNTGQGTYAYQLTDHLGNVRAVVVKDGTSALSVTNKTDYYPFGMPMPDKTVDGGYRYGYQGEYAEKESGIGEWAELFSAKNVGFAYREVDFSRSC